LLKETGELRFSNARIAQKAMQQTALERFVARYS